MLSHPGLAKNLSVFNALVVEEVIHLNPQGMFGLTDNDSKMMSIYTMQDVEVKNQTIGSESGCSFFF